MIRTVGKLVGKVDEASRLVTQIDQSLPPFLTPTLRVLYLIWRKPYMAAANHTFIHDMLRVAGFDNALANQTRYPVITADALRQAQPDLIFLSSEPYPFAEKHRAEFETICPDARVVLVDGELFSWYGSRLIRSGAYFTDLRRQLLTQ
jgi:ABC-type Fe3+-hydroxamate transport system substrate-binding protein